MVRALSIFLGSLLSVILLVSAAAVPPVAAAWADRATAVPHIFAGALPPYRTITAESFENLSRLRLTSMSSFQRSDLEREMALAKQTYEEAPPEVQATIQGRNLSSATLYAQRTAEDMRATISAGNSAFSWLEQASDEFDDQRGRYQELLDELADIFERGRGSVSAVNTRSGQSLVSYRQDEEFIAASTYKIFIAYSMIRAVEAKSILWSDYFGGTTLAECFDRMIVYSDNDCPEEWLHQHGYRDAEQSAKLLGAKNTVFSPSGFHTTASDLSASLRNLTGPDKISGKSRIRLLKALKKQEFREGIPAAIEPHGGTVANKVGFLDGYLHDAAIIDTDKGRFTVVIMTEDLSWDAISEAAEAIYRYL